MTMFVMSLWAICTATILISSKTLGQMMAGRILNYVYIGMELSTCPVYQAEIVPSPIRGFAVGTYQLSLLFGGIVINSVCRGTSTLEGNKSWQIPMGLFYICPLTIASLIWFMPESPRWLLLKGRSADAAESLRRLRGKNATEHDIEEEVALLTSSIEQHVEEGSYLDLFRGTNLRRTMIGIGMNFFVQATGSPFTASYGTLFVKSVGALNPFDFSITASCGNAIACMIALAIVDRVGRRPLLFVGGVLMLTWLLTMASIGTLEDPSLSQKNMIIACLALFQASQSVSWAPLCYVITTETCSTRLRDKTQRVASAVNILTSFVVSFTVPYLLNAPYANLESKVGYIYGGMTVLALLFAFFCVPETKGRSLETIDRMFVDRVSVWQFGKRSDMYEEQQPVQQPTNKKAVEEVAEKEETHA